MAEEHAEQNDDWAALSSMADGEAGPAGQQRCLALWATSAQARERWRHYQLIGDVLRSQELARDSGHDAAFLQALRERLSREPVVLRPAAPRVARHARSWAAPMSAVAGVAAVAGVVVVLRTAPDTGQPALAARDVPVPMVVAAPAAAVQAPAPQVVNGKLIRDARLERYFAAHRQSANGAALQMPGAVVRSVDTIVLEDR